MALAKDTRAMLEAAFEGKEEVVLKFLEKGWENLLDVLSLQGFVCSCWINPCRRDVVTFMTRFMICCVILVICGYR